MSMNTDHDRLNWYADNFGSITPLSLLLKASNLSKGQTPQPWHYRDALRSLIDAEIRKEGK